MTYVQKNGPLEAVAPAIAKELRWAEARSGIIAALAPLNPALDSAIRGRFNSLIDAINKQFAAGVADEKLVLDAIKRGRRSPRELREALFYEAQDLERILSNLERAGRISRISRGEFSIRNRRAELQAVISAIADRGEGFPVTLKEIAEITGFSRRRLQDLVKTLVKGGRISRTRAGFKLGTGPGEPHDPDCLCKSCLAAGGPNV